MATLPDGLGSAEDLKKRFAIAKTRRELWRSILQDMYDFCLPNRETFNFHTPGQRKSRHLFDSTGVESLQTFVSIITSSLTPDSSKWMKYEAGSDIPEEDKKNINKELEKATDAFFKHMSHSDFPSQVNVSHQDMAISTGCLMVEQGNDIDEPLLKFTAIPLSELYIEPTSLARIHTFWREYDVKAQEILIKFPEADIPSKLKKIIEKSPMADVKIVDGSQVFNFKTKTYHQVVMWENEILFTQSYGTSAPGIIYRWSKVAGESYGRGPADMAMSDIRSLNKVKEYMLMGAALTLMPPMMGVSDTIFNPHTASLTPGSIIAVSSVDKAPLKTIEMGGDLRLAQFEVEEMKNNIRKLFFADPLGDITDPVRSATENIIRQQEMLKKRGANLGRLKSEFIFPLVERVTHILSDAGKIPPIKMDGREVTLKMSSPLASMEQTENIDNVVVFLNIMQNLPEQVQLLGASLESVPSYLQENLNLPEEFARSKEQIEAAQQTIIESAQNELAQGGPPGAPPPQGAPPVG